MPTDRFDPDTLGILAIQLTFPTIYRALFYCSADLDPPEARLSLNGDALTDAID